MKQQNAETAVAADSCFDQKQATGHDSSRTAQDLFEGVRPSIVLDEAETQDTFTPEVVAEHAADNILDMTVRMSTVFEDQFVSKYLPRILPWALNYDCGGADYPKLFANWEEVLENQDKMLTEGIQQRWRKLADEAVLLPGEYAKMLATRSEIQLGSDWMVVPSSRNLHWRYTVLHSAFMVCKQKVAPGETLSHNLTELIEATKKIWKRISSNSVMINKQKKNINGNLGMLFSADDISSTEKIILRSYLNTTASIAGCQAIRLKMGHCCFGFRVVHGEVIFVTVSPNRRHSAMVLKLSRARRNDASLLGEDAVSRERRKHCGPEGPHIFSKWSVTEDPNAERTSVEIPLPDILTRQAWNAQDPLASCHHYLFFMHVILPAVFGIRMCFLCPHCNTDSTDPTMKAAVQNSSSDYMGCNSKQGFGAVGSERKSRSSTTWCHKTDLLVMTWIPMVLTRVSFSRSLWHPLSSQGPSDPWSSLDIFVLPRLAAPMVLPRRFGPMMLLRFRHPESAPPPPLVLPWLFGRMGIPRPFVFLRLMAPMVLPMVFGPMVLPRFFGPMILPRFRRPEACGPPCGSPVAVLTHGDPESFRLPRGWWRSWLSQCLSDPWSSRGMWPLRSPPGFS